MEMCMVWIAEIKSAERKAIVLEGQTPGEIELGALSKTGLPTAAGRKRLALQGEFKDWTVSHSDSDWASYLSAYGVSPPTGAHQLHVLYRQEHQGLQLVVPALAFMRAFFKPTTYLLEKMFSPGNVDGVSFVDHSNGVANVVIDDTELGWRVRAVQSGNNKESCIRWLQLSRSARAMAQSVHLLAANGMLGFCMPCGQHRMVLHGVQNGSVLFVNHVSLMDVVCDASDSITGTREQYIFHEAAKKVRQPSATTADYQVPMHLDGSTATTDAEWLVLSDILKANSNRRMRHCQRSLFDAVLAKIATNQPWKSDAAQRWNKTDVTNAFRRWVMTGRMQSAINALEKLRSDA